MGAPAEPIVSRARLIVVVAVATTAFLALGLAQAPVGQQVLRATGLAATGPAVVELYLPAGRHPPSATPESPFVPVTFVVDGHGARAVDVSWQVRVGHGRSQRVVARGSTSLPPRRRLLVRRSVDLGCAEATVGRVTPLQIALVGRPQRLRFATTCVAGAGGAPTGESAP